MTRSSTKELFTPFKDPERELRSSRKHYKTLSLDESRSPDFNLFSDQEEYSKEEVAETMAETMEQYMSKTKADYGSGVARPKIKYKDNFELKANFLRNYEVVLLYNGLDVPTRQILDSRGDIPSNTVADAKKLHDLIQDVLRERFSTARKDYLCLLTNVYEILLDAWDQQGPHYTKDYPLKEEGKTLEEAYYTQFGTPFQGGGYKATALGFYQRNNANPSYQERRQSMEDNLSKFMSESAKRHEENSNLIKEIRASMDAAIRNQGASIKILEIQIGK
ncbi:hypothetical protein Tco_1134989 [Tanacetum coccineum]